MVFISFWFQPFTFSRYLRRFDGNLLVEKAFTNRLLGLLYYGGAHNKDETDRFLSLSFWSQQTQGRLLNRFKVNFVVKDQILRD